MHRKKRNITPANVIQKCNNPKVLEYYNQKLIHINNKMPQINQKLHPYLKHNENVQQHNKYHVMLNLNHHSLKQHQ